MASGSLTYGHQSENEEPELEYKGNNVLPLGIVNTVHGPDRL